MVGEAGGRTVTGSVMLDGQHWSKPLNACTDGRMTAMCNSGTDKAYLIHHLRAEWLAESMQDELCSG